MRGPAARCSRSRALDPAATPVHHLLDDGSFAITVPGDGMLAGMVVAAGAAGVQAVLEMTDYAPLPLREPVRSLVWIRGRLHDVPDGEVAGTARPDRRPRIPIPLCCKSIPVPPRDDADATR